MLIAFFWGMGIVPLTSFLTAMLIINKPSFNDDEPAWKRKGRILIGYIAVIVLSWLLLITLSIVFLIQEYQIIKERKQNEKDN